MHQDTEYVHLVNKYHKMEKNTTQLFSEIELFQAPLSFSSFESVWNNTISDPFSSALKRYATDDKELDIRVNNEIEDTEINRLDIIEDKTHSMIE